MFIGVLHMLDYSSYSSFPPGEVRTYLTCKEDSQIFLISDFTLKLVDFLWDAGPAMQGVEESFLICALGSPELRIRGRYLGEVIMEGGF